MSTDSWGNSSSASSQLYTLADLEILSQEENYREFFKHALDIRPSERGDAWKSMVSKMADVYTQNVLKGDSVDSKDFKQIHELYTWPTLKADEFFRQRRGEIGLRYLQKCLKLSSPCWSDVKAFWQADQEQPELAYKLAELIAPHKDASPIALWTILDPALKSTYSEFYCQKPFVMQTLWSKLELDYVRLGPQGDLTIKIDQTIHPDCLPYLMKEAKNRVYHPDAVTDRELGFQILKSQKKADTTITDFFHGLYLLEKPSQGELFNYAWNGIKELGSSPERRDAVMKEMRKLDPLPDELLGSLDQVKKRAVLTHFKQNFPEYLDFYVKKCVDFYGGKAQFPNGNPTMHCQELMSSELAPQIFDQYRIKQYHDVRKI